MRGFDLYHNVLEGDLHATQFSRIVNAASTKHSVAYKRLQASPDDGRCPSEPRWRRSEEKVITDEFSRTSRLDEAINAQRGIATPSSASSAVLGKSREEEPILLIRICLLSFCPRYSLSIYSHSSS